MDPDQANSSNTNQKPQLGGHAIPPNAKKLSLRVKCLDHLLTFKVAGPNASAPNETAAPRHHK